MDWLAQNWTWIALAVGGVFLFTRMGAGGCGMGGCGMGRSMGANRGQSGTGQPAEPGTGTGNTVDPVSRHALPAGSAVSAVYQNHAYYFESRENLDAFESDPERYLAGSAMVGQAMGSDRASIGQPQRRRGC